MDIFDDDLYHELFALKWHKIFEKNILPIKSYGPQRRTDSLKSPLCRFLPPQTFRIMVLSLSIVPDKWLALSL
jgi:hypothetical protein